MKILIYNQYFYPSVGGTEASGRIMAQELAALGHDVTVYTASERADASPELDEGYQIIRAHSLSKLLRAAQTHDVILSRGGMSLRALLARLITRTPLVVFHEMAEQMPSQAPTFRQNLLARVKAKSQRLDALHVCVSSTLQSTLAHGTRSLRLYNPISNTLWTENPPAFKDRNIDVAFIGRIAESKGALILGEALKHIAQTRDLHVVIVGTGPAVPALQQMLDTPCITVDFRGNLSGKDLKYVYANAKVIAIPSLAREGMGMVAAEALGSGTPVCTSTDPALQEVVATAGRFHLARDFKYLADDITVFMDDQCIWNAASRAARQRRTAFSMQQYRHSLAHDICPVLQEISDGSAPQNG
ncbi:glycosyltransferase family 4 protein [Yoonia sp. MH D7]